MIVEIGATAIDIQTDDPVFRAMIHSRYGNFVVPAAQDPIALHVELVPPSDEADADLTVTLANHLWRIDRGDFHATYDPALRLGHVRQTANPWSVDALIRIVHSLELAHSQGFLLHAASAILNNRAFVFTGVSGAGKTTISRLAPPAATLLTDEISYLRLTEKCATAWGTPFAGELGTPGRNISAPVAALCFLEHAPQNRLTPLNRAEALQRLLRNILFFADDSELVQLVFNNAADFLERIPAWRLEFKPDNDVWALLENL